MELGSNLTHYRCYFKQCPALVFPDMYWVSALRDLLLISKYREKINECVDVCGSLNVILSCVC